MNNLDLKPDDFLKYILDTLNTTGNMISLEEFSQYTEKKSEVWNTENYKDMFFILIDFLEERIPRRIYNIEDLKEDLDLYLKEKKRK